MEESREKMLDALNRRELERKLDYRTRQLGKDATDAASEKIDFFELTFEEKRTEILESIELSSKISVKQLPDHFNDIFSALLSLQKYVAGSNIFLRTYDIKRYQNMLNELTNRTKDLETLLLPKRKFNFKNRKETNRSETDSAKAPVKVNNVNLNENYTGFKDVTDETLKLSREETLKKDVTLHNLTNCEVRIYGAPSTLHLNNLKNCKVYSGPVSTSVFADTCYNSILALSCQQLRLHTSRDVTIFLHVTSRAIMEDCTEITIAPYNLHYDGIEADYSEANLNPTINNWKCVDDFNWLNVEKPSPHWKILTDVPICENN